MRRIINLSIKSKIILAIALTTLIASAIIAIFQWDMNSKLVEKEASEKLLQLCQNYSDSFEMNILHAKKTVDILYDEITNNIDYKNVNDANYLNRFVNELNPYVKTLANNSSNGKTAYVYFNPKLTDEAFDIYYADDNDDGKVERQRRIPVSYYNDYNGDKSKDWWFIPLQTKKANWTDPYEWSLDSGEKVTFISYTKPLYYKNKLICVVGTDLRYDNTRKMLENYKVFKTGYLFLLNDRLDVLIDKAYKSGSNLKKVDLEGYDLISKNKGENVDNIVTATEKSKGQIIVFSRLSNGWVLGIAVKSKEIYSELYKNQYITFIFIIGLLMIFILLSLKLGNLISNPIIQITNQIENIKENELSLNFSDELINRKDEIGVLSKVLNKMSLKIIEYFNKVTEQKLVMAEEIDRRIRIQNELEMTLKILSSSKDGVFIADSKLRAINTNPAFEDITGFGDEDLRKNNIIECGIGLGDGVFNKIKSDGNWTGELIQKRKNGEEYKSFIFMNKVYYNNEDYYIGIIRDLTEELAKEHEIYYYKNYDYLTNLPNNFSFRERVQKYFNKDSEDTSNHALIILNVDNFRIVNEAKGFEFGNTILVEIAKRIKGCLNKEDLLSRTDGDEFGIFIADIKDSDELYEKVNQLNNLFDMPFKIGNEHISLSACFGVSIYPTDGEDYEELTKTATSALNHIKRNNTGSVEFYNENINKITLEKYEILNNLRHALEKNEFYLVYQPQIDIIKNKVIGVEALIRWKNDMGFIPPDLFIPIAEESRLIIPIGEWVLKTACNFGYELYKLGYKMTIAVNISRIQFKPNYLITLINTVLEESKLPPELLELEITESLLMDNEKECEALLKSLKRMGVKISIDDFGTGYSSLAYLKKFVVDKIKIDRSFIKDIPYSDDGMIANVIIQLSKNLGINVIAEGAETNDHINFLIENDCNEVQGFYYSKPINEEELIEFLKSFS